MKDLIGTISKEGRGKNNQPWGGGGGENKLDKKIGYYPKVNQLGAQRCNIHLWKFRIRGEGFGRLQVPKGPSLPL